MADILEVVIWGAGAQGEIVHYILRCNSEVRVRAFLDDEPARRGKQLNGIPVLQPDLETLLRLREEGVSHGIVAIGDGVLREKLSGRLEQLGYEIASAIHPTAHVPPETHLGKGAIIDSLSNFGYNPVVGNYVLVSISVTVGHDSSIDDNTWLSAGTVVSSRVHIGKNVHIGPGATIVPKNFGSLTIGDGAIVGAGSLVMEDVLPGTVVVGAPARIIRCATNK